MSENPSSIQQKLHWLCTTYPAPATVCGPISIPLVRGWTESLALVKRDMSFRGPPLALCSRWYFFSSERGRKRFIILWYWTSTWQMENMKENQFNPHQWDSCLEPLAMNMKAFNCLYQLANSLYRYHAPFGVFWFAWCIIMDIFLVKLSVVHICLLYNLEKTTQVRHYFIQPVYISIYFHLGKTEAYFHDSYNPRFLAVAVVKERLLP